MGTPAACACSSTFGQRAAASSAVMFDCAWKFGSLKVRRNFAPAATAVFTSLLPHIIGTNSTPLSPLPFVAQLYHQPTPGEKSGPGAVLAAIPRLQSVVTGAPPMPASPLEPATPEPLFPASDCEPAVPALAPPEPALPPFIAFPADPAVFALPAPPPVPLPAFVAFPAEPLLVPLVPPLAPLAPPLPPDPPAPAPDPAAPAGEASSSLEQAAKAKSRRRHGRARRMSPRYHL